jgi:hypothetical protein
MQRRLTILLCLTAALILSRDRPVHTLVNGSADFDHEAVGTILVHEPGHPRGDWGIFCSAFLIHERVLLTAGHCVQQIRAQLAEGILLDARISLQQDPFDAATYVEGDPDASGWYAIDDLVDNPDSPDWLDIPNIVANWGTWHDQGAVVLSESVTDIGPLRVPWTHGLVERLTRLQCELVPHGFCEPLLVAYGLPELPPTVAPNERQAVVTTYLSIDPLFIHTAGDPGDACLGDSGGAVIMRWFGGSDMAVALISSPADPFAPFCTGSTLQYRLDTPSSLRFIREVIRNVEQRPGHWRARPLDGLASPVRMKSGSAAAARRSSGHTAT